MRISDWSSDVCSSDLQQRAGGGPALQKLRQLDRLGEFGERGAPALFARFDDLRLDPLALDALDDRALGDHGLQAGDAEFGRLFNDPVEPRLLDRREAEPEVDRKSTRTNSSN